MEQFYEIPFSPDYVISKSGTVKHKETGRICQPWVDKWSGNLKVVIGNKGEQKYFTLSRLLALVFIPLVAGKNFIDFKDGNKANCSLDNLKWSTQNEIHGRASSRRLQESRTKFKIPTFSSDTGFYFDQIKECSIKPGFYYVPRSRNAIVINKEGHLFNLQTDQNHPVRLSHKGYIITTLRTKFTGIKYTTEQVHRLVAETFIRPAEEYANYKANDLQVNHIDGNKRNNNVENLEWVDGFKNMNHARDNGLFSNQKPVITKNLLTGDIMRFRSVSKCAEYFDIMPACLFFHLSSASSGIVPLKGTFFKYDDSAPWPSFSAEYSLDEALSYSGDYVAINKDLNKVIVYSSLNSAIEGLNLSKILVKNHRQRKGKDAPYQGWIFKPISDFTHRTEKL